MADSFIAITAGTGTNVDTRTESTNSHHRQVIVIGDPATNAGVAPVDSTTGLVVNPTGTAVGSLTETAPGTDTASSGLNGRLQRVAQRLTALIALLPTALTGSGNLKVAIVEDTAGSTIDTDDGSVAGAQASIALTIGMPYTWSGAAWARGGLTPYKTISAASTNATSLKGSAGVVGMVVVMNTNAAVRYLKFYNKATAPTVGTDTPVQVYTIPGATTGGGVAIAMPEKGLAFSTGIAFALTTGVADTDTTGVAANEIVVNVGYL